MFVRLLSLSIFKRLKIYLFIIIYNDKEKDVNKIILFKQSNIGRNWQWKQFNIKAAGFLHPSRMKNFSNFDVNICLPKMVYKLSIK